ncbi:T9SS type B sorting domain-containing protein [Flavobacterium hauense]
MNCLLDINIFQTRLSKFTYYGLLGIFFLFVSPVFAQLQDFQIEVTTTNETCSGNGSFSFAIINGTPGATVNYTVYKLPDTTNPISISSSNTLGSLTAGTYKIIAVQALGQQSNSQEAEATIVKIASPFDFDVSATNQACIEGAKIIITVTEGTAAFYEIISGPVLRPIQESNVFADMPAGVYVIRVFNECGDADVTTYTLVTSSAGPSISEPSYESNVSGDCDTVTVTNIVSYGEGIAITYPITIEYTLTPSDGNPPIIVVQTFETGNEVELALTHTFSTGDSDYSYTIKITDSCNNQYESGDMILNPELSIDFSANIINPCGTHYLSIIVLNFSPPFNLNFVSAPVGFVASAFNPSYPGPYTQGSVVFGDLETPVITGDYKVEVVDNCGKMASVEFTIEDEEVEAVAGGSSNGCTSALGRITATVPGRKIVSAFIIDAPEDYTDLNALPKNATGNIASSGVLVLVDMPQGDYMLRIVDECGNEFDVPVEVPPFELKGFTGMAMSGCAAGSGAVRISSANGKMASMSMTDAPDEYNETLPVNVSSFINGDGIFYIESLPIGEYTFSGVDFCGVEETVTVIVTAGTPPGDAVTFTRKCGNFDLRLSDSGTETFAEPPTYWLQKLVNVEDDIWGHPATNVVFIEETEPNEQNSMLLINGQTLTDLEYEGTFRVIKYFESYISPNDLQACFGALTSFEYTDGVKVKNAYNLSCNHASDDIYVEATGLAPLHYTIISKNDAPFSLDNGDNSIFSNLDPGKYEFQVEDDCGFVGTLEVDIRQLPELTKANDPGDMQVCIQPSGSETAEFDLSVQTPLILGNQPASVYTVTYYLSAEDAEAGTNEVSTLFTNTSNPQLMYARLVHDHISLCHDVTSFNLRVTEYPVLKMKRDYILCNDDNGVNISADSGYNNYEWSTGETTSTIRVNESGDYWVKVGNEYGGFVCDTKADISVVISGPADRWTFDVTDWTDSSNSIAIHTTGAGNYEYSLDGKKYQDEPLFSNLDTGIYTVYIKDKNGCGIVSDKVVLLNYPKFFTPNGDSINEKWRLEYSWFEPEARIYIYDRYGKLIYGFTPLDSGWDGTFNGAPLPATDYWFVVLRKDGEIHKGHFSMIR